MADSKAFDYASDWSDSGSSRRRLGASGTVPLALKEAVLEPRSVSGLQMSAVMTQLMPKELANRGVENADTLCRSISSALAALPDDGGMETPESVFQRLGGNG